MLANGVRAPERGAHDHRLATVATLARAMAREFPTKVVASRRTISETGLDGP